MKRKYLIVTVLICFSMMGLFIVMPITATAIHQAIEWKYFLPDGQHYYPQDRSYWLSSGYLNGFGYRFFAINKYIADTTYMVPALRNFLKGIAALVVVLAMVNYLWEGIEVDNEKRKAELD